MQPRSRLAVLTAALLLVPATALASKHETWVEVRSPNFNVISNAGENRARRIAVQFEQVRSLFRNLMTIVGQVPTPVITIFAVKDEGSMRELLPEYWTKNHSHPAGIFFSRLGQFYAAVRLDAEGENPYETVYHEYYHSLTLPYYPGLPLWLAEGFAEFFGNTRISDKEAVTGQAGESMILELRQNSLIPLNVLFSVDHRSPYYNEQSKTSVFYAESWALTHYFMIADNGAHRQILSRYLAALGQGTSQRETALKEFGDLDVLQHTLQNYIRNSTFWELKTAAPPKTPDAELQARVLSDADVDAYLGGFAAARGHTQEAKPLLAEALRLDPKLALAYQNLALAQFFEGQQTEALSSVSQAIALDPKNSLTLFLRAYLTITDGGPVPRDPQVEEDLRRSIAASPNFAPPYGLLAVYLAARQENLPEALSLALKAISLEPGTANYQIDLAQVLMRMHRYDDAQVAALRARTDAITPQEQTQADQFLALLQRVRSMQGNNGPASIEEDPATQ